MTTTILTVTNFSRHLKITKRTDSCLDVSLLIWVIHWGAEREWEDEEAEVRVHFFIFIGISLHSNRLECISMSMTTRSTCHENSLDARKFMGLSKKVFCYFSLKFFFQYIDFIEKKMLFHIIMYRHPLSLTIKSSKVIQPFWNGKLPFQKQFPPPPPPPFFIFFCSVCSRLLAVNICSCETCVVLGSSCEGS